MGGCAWGLLIFLAFFLRLGGGFAAGFYSLLLPPWSLLGDGGTRTGRGREERKSAGSGFQGGSGPLGRNDWEPHLGSRASGRS